MTKKLLYVHSGGVTSVLNRSLDAICSLASEKNMEVMTVPFGLLGLLSHRPVALTGRSLPYLGQTPASILSTTRSRPSDEDLHCMLEVLTSEAIEAVIVQGGNDSQETLLRLHQLSEQEGRQLLCLGLPKTIDNDLCGLHVTPGYPSAAKYLAVSWMEAAWDMMAMHHSSSRVLVFETMGRDAGWLAAASTLAGHRHEIAHALCVPERMPSHELVLENVDHQIRQQGYAMLSVAEGCLWTPASNGEQDGFGHPQLQGQGQWLAQSLRQALQVKVRYVRCDLLQRSAGHLLSRYDWDLAWSLGQAALACIQQGQSGVMLGTASEDCRDVSLWPLAMIARQVRSLPEAFLASSGLQIHDAFCQYLEPLITGEVYPSYDRGLPQYHPSIRYQPKGEL